MKKQFLALVAASGLLLSGSALAAMKIGVVDIQSILKESPKVEKMRTDMKNKFASKEKEMRKLQGDLQGLMQKYAKEQSVMSKKQKTNIENKINDGRRKLQALQMAFQKSYMEEQNKALTAIMGNVKEKVAAVAKKGGFDIVIDQNAVAYAKDGQDVTEKVISSMK